MPSPPPVNAAPAPAPEPLRVRRHLWVEGVVQGVGFRPHVYGLTQALGLAGFVRNVSQGVEIEIEGSPEAVAAFELRLASEAPVLARLESVASEERVPLGRSGFEILASTDELGLASSVPPDVAVCEACLAELADPADRRHRYPFLNCTDCGPRFTVIESLPYDRERTTLAGFTLCADCAREYHDPTNRRFHAEPTACPVCGPRLLFQKSAAEAPEAEGEEALARALALLAAGGALAIKGVGGFHLACDATQPEAVARLRQRKGRPDKPFAIMVRDLEVAERYAVLSEAAKASLLSPARPIVLAPSRAHAEPPLGPAVAPGLCQLGPAVAPGLCQLGPAVAPGQWQLGVMLPYAPIHHLLLGDRPLVMTSGNASEEPITFEDAEAARLSGMVDGFLLHDRPIANACDDSVIKVWSRGELPVRRSRGYAPLPVALAAPAAPLVAVGGEMKATFCLTRGRRAWLSQHLGDLETLEAQRFFERALAQLGALLRVEPQAVACDLHPGYLSGRWAERYAAERGVPLVRVQHHHAHIAAVLAERGWVGDEPVLGLCCDGTGYGTDGTIWGGELLLASYGASERLGHLKAVALPGGDGAVRRPPRLALVHLAAAGLEWAPELPPSRAMETVERRVLARQLETGAGCVSTTSLGRLFDAVSALLGLCERATFEGQAALKLEGTCSLPLGDAAAAGPGFALVEHAGRLELDPAPVLAGLVEGLLGGVALGVLASRFHEAVAQALAEAAAWGNGKTGVRTVALSGGVFQNGTLLERVVPLLEARGLRPLWHRVVPPNDGGLALGQAAVAAFGRGAAAELA